VINLLLGGITLFLIGLGLPGAFRKVQASYGWEVLLYALAILLVVQLIRFGIVYITFRWLSKPATKSAKTRAEALLVAWSGARSFFAVLMVLVLPQTTPAGQPFILRDLFVVLICLTTLLSLTVQGLTLPRLVHWSGLAGSPDLAQQEQLVRHELALAALQILQEYPSQPTQAEESWQVANLTRQYEGWLDQARITSSSSNIAALNIQPDSGPISTKTFVSDPALLELRQRLVAAKARALSSLREGNLIADEVLARYQLELDLEAEWLRSSLYTA
jgi:NhaP-type Na+/H+ or K+/H+ antiporter